MSTSATAIAMPSVVRRFKVCWQIQEDHVEHHLPWKNLYTILLMTLVKPGGIVLALEHILGYTSSKRDALCSVMPSWQRPTIVHEVSETHVSEGNERLKQANQPVPYIVYVDHRFNQHLINNNVANSKGKRALISEGSPAEVYVQLFPQVSCYLKINMDRAIYGQGRFRSFTYSLHQTLQADPQAGTNHERKMAQEVHCSRKQWLVMKERTITEALHMVHS
ncbi:hypothetical protein QQF64_030675 [Cirrhinus molitorella]|uniref:Uncharacterized protein n=1 Tax=Cirrhinus molitorella TaxID=172907 RepID=A0ABR3N451_9TELE